MPLFCADLKLFTMRKRFPLFTTFLLAVSAVHFCLAQTTPGQALRLWYDHPAEKWTDALPVGNGRLGAMVFGGVFDERIQFNEDTLWKGHPHDYVRAGARD